MAEETTNIMQNQYHQPSHVQSLDDNHKIIPKKRCHKELQDESKEIPTKKRRKSSGGKMYEVERILGDRESLRRKGEIEYLIQWKDYPIYDSSWHHKENFENTSIIQQYEALPKKEKKRRYTSWINSYRRYVENKRRTNVTPLRAERGVQTLKDDESESDDVEISHPRCTGDEDHWKKVKDVFDVLNASTQFATVINRSVIKDFMCFITNTLLYLRSHKCCDQELDDMKSKLNALSSYLEEISSIYNDKISPVRIETAAVVGHVDMEMINDLQPPNTEQEEISDDYCLIHEVGSQDLSPASQTDVKINDKQDACDSDQDYDIKNDK